MQPLLALLTITLSLSGAAFAADDHYTCNRTDTAGSAPSKFDLRRWADLLRIKLSLSGNTVFAGTDAGSFRFKDFTSQKPILPSGYPESLYLCGAEQRQSAA